MIRSDDVSHWLVGVSDTLKERVIPEIEDEYIKEQVVAAYVLTRLAHRWLSDPRELAATEAVAARDMFEGLMEAARTLEERAPADGVTNAFQMLIGELKGGGTVSRIDQRLLESVEAGLQLLWESSHELPEGVFDAARSSLRDSWVRTVEQDSGLYGSAK